MKTFEKLRIRIEKDLGIKLKNFQRCYVGRHQRSRGAFVWTAECVEYSESVGSGVSATELLKQDKIIELPRQTVSFLRELA